MNKQDILRLLITQLESELEVSQRSAEAARDAATNEESKSEDKHDTRSIEAGYLAGAQRKRVAELKELINFLKILKPKEFSESEPVSATARVTVEVEGQTLHYFVLPQGGGLKVRLSGLEIQTVTPQTPLGEALLGMRVGDAVFVETKNVEREYEITAIV